MSFSSVSPESPYNDLPLTTLQSAILTTGPLVFFWSILSRYISRSGPMPLFATITKYNSQLYAIFSAGLAYLIYRSYFEPVQVCTFLFPLPILGTDTVRVETWMLGYVYHISKFYEYIDIFNLVTQGIAINPHMAFHHITTPYLTYFRIIALPQPSASSSSSLSGWPDSTPAGLPAALTRVLGARAVHDWRVFALANSIHHTLMYAYFGHMGSWLRNIIPITGWLQLVLGFATDAYWMYATEGGKTGLRLEEGEKNEEATNRGIAILILARYAMLYWEERTQIRETEGKRVVGRKEREEKERDEAGRAKKRN